MIRTFLAGAKPEERSALRLMLLDLNMEVAGEVLDWASVFELAPACQPNMLLIDWNLLPPNPQEALAALRSVCPSPIVIVLISHLDARQQAALSSGADAFISKHETPERVAEHLQSAAKIIAEKVPGKI